MKLSHYVMPWILETCGISNLSDSGLMEGIRSLNTGFLNWDEGDPYAKNPDLVDAYAVYYMPSNMPKLMWLYDRNPWLQKGVSEKDEIHVLDYGCGPGTNTFASLFYFAETHPDLLSKLHIKAVDQSPQFLDLVEQLFTSLQQKDSRFKDVALVTHHSDKIPEGSFDIAVFGNVLREGSLDGLNRVNADNIVLIEPATKENFRNVLKARDDLICSGWHVRFPCLHSKDCPISSPKDWCHMTTYFEPPKEIEVLSQKLRMNKHVLPHTSFVFSKDPPEKKPSENTCVCVSNLMDQKGLYCCFLCGQQGRLKIELLKRHVSDSNRTFTTLTRGDRVEFSQLKGNRIKADSSVKIQKP